MKYVVDMHSHPSLKTYLYDEVLDKKDATSKEFNPRHMQVDIPKMIEGNVNLVMAAHYLPEIGLLKYCALLKSARFILDLLFKDLVDKVEKAAPSRAFKQTMSALTGFEKKVIESDKKYKAIVAKNYDELSSALSAGKRVFIHTIEGAHSLGRNLKSEQTYLKNLKEFSDAGVCMMTLAHFFENDIVAPIDGFPPSMKRLLSCNPPPNSRPGLSVVGEAVVRSMLDMGMIVDLTHSTHDARTRVFDILSEVNENRVAKGKRRRPIVFSHVGVRGLFNNVMNPSDEEILKVKECNGVIGVIFINYWLSGREENDFLGFIGKRDPGMEYIYNTIEHIHRITGSYDNIAIGTDFDGFTDPPDDLHDISKFPALKSFLLKKGIKQNDVNRIMGGNVLRVLQHGWR